MGVNLGDLLRFELNPCENCGRCAPMWASWCGTDCMMRWLRANSNDLSEIGVAIDRRVGRR